MKFRYPILSDESLIDFLNSYYLSKDKISYLINNSCIRKNNTILNSLDNPLKLGDIITIDTTYYDECNMDSIYKELDILYEDDYLLIIDKEKDTIIYDLDGGACLDKYVLSYYERCGINLIPRHLQRLDKDTTGCIIYTKDILSLSKLSHDLESGLIDKYYHCLCQGVINKDFICDKPISTNRHVNGEMVVTKSGKPSKTIFKVLKKYSDKTLLECKLITGRKHQIRVHLQSVGHPIIGDKIYNKNSNNSDLMLNCHCIEFNHPVTNERLVITSNKNLD